MGETKLIRSMRITKTESQVFMHQDEMQKHKITNIAYDFSLEDPKIIKSKTDGKDTIGIGYNFSIVYTNPSMGYLRYQGDVVCPESVNKPSDVTDELRNEIAHTIMLNILPLALLSSRSMGLPPAVPLPFPPNIGQIEKHHETEIKGYG